MSPASPIAPVQQEPKDPRYTEAMENLLNQVFATAPRTSEASRYIFLTLLDSQGVLTGPEQRELLSMSRLSYLDDLVLQHDALLKTATASIPGASPAQASSWLYPAGQIEAPVPVSPAQVAADLFERDLIRQEEIEDITDFLAVFSLRPTQGALLLPKIQARFGGLALPLVWRGLEIFIQRHLTTTGSAPISLANLVTLRRGFLTFLGNADPLAAMPEVLDHLALPRAASADPRPRQGS